MREVAVGILSLSLFALSSACSSSAAIDRDETPNQLAFDEPPAGGDPCELMIRFNRRCAEKGPRSTAACADARRQQCDEERASQSEAYRNAIGACVGETTACSADVAGCIV